MQRFSSHMARNLQNYPEPGNPLPFVTKTTINQNGLERFSIQLGFNGLLTRKDRYFLYKTNCGRTEYNIVDRQAD